jgi:DNA-binding PadR family transcriptional regulator
VVKKKRKALPVGAVMILHALARGAAYGFDIIEETGLTSGTVYPTLERLESTGLARSKWEDSEEARAEGRPARRYFQITADGKAVLIEALDRYRAIAPVNIDGVIYPVRARPS